MTTNTKNNYKGYTIVINHESSGVNPLDKKTLGTIACFNDDKPMINGRFKTPEDVWDHIKASKAVYLPVYMFKLGTIMELTTTVSEANALKLHCGYVFVELSKAQKQMKHERIGAAVRRKIEEELKHEVEMYNSYLNSNSYSYEVQDRHKDVVDGRGGYPTKTRAIIAARRTVDDLHDLMPGYRKKDNYESA